ncbi:Putative LOC100741061, partial [Caligus rogercresseyi]
RKKSLPDVQSLVGVTKSQGSTEMTREEISLLSSTRRDVLRKQLEEIEKYKSNPLLYFISPTFK